MNKDSVYCCEDMKLFLLDAKDPIKYNRSFREYYIELSDKNNIITMSFCPWCGAKLHKRLREEFFDTLEKEYGIETDIGEVWGRPDLPPEFRTDEWWKKRGL